MDIKSILNEYNEKLLDETNRSAFDLNSKWSKSISLDAGVYAFFKGENILYIGETGSLRGRMSDVRRTVNHTFRRAIGNKLFSNVDGFIEATSKNKFPSHIETKVDKYMEGLHIVVLPVPFGRAEVEEYLIEKYNPKFNTKKKRKIK